jgi:hypothetical protein
MSGARFENGQLVDVPPATIEEAIEESRALMHQGLVMPESNHGPKPLAAIVGVTSGRLEPEEAAAAEQARLRELIERGEARTLAGRGTVVKVQAGYCGTCKATFHEFFGLSGERLSQPGCSRCAERADLASLVGQHHETWVALPDELDVTAREWAEFRSRSPRLAELLSRSFSGALDASAKPPVVALGICHVPRSLWNSSRSHELTEAILGVFDRHSAGDFGIHGLLSEAPLDDNARFAPALATQTQRNALALEIGVGAIRSSYPLSDGLAWTLFERQRQTEYWIEVTTVPGQYRATYLRMTGSGRPWKPEPLKLPTLAPRSKRGAS